MGMKGGRRIGAGRPGWHKSAERCLSLDVRQLQREGCLEPHPGRSWVWHDSATGQEVDRIGYSVERDAVVLRYARPGQEGIWVQRLGILRTACAYGGDRPWFGCSHCGRRVALVYFRAFLGFACRSCANVAYESQGEDEVNRAWRKQLKIEQRLGEHRQRPKGMHQSTHTKLLSELAKCEDRKIAATVAAATRLFPRLAGR